MNFFNFAKGSGDGQGSQSNSNNNSNYKKNNNNNYNHNSNSNQNNSNNNNHSYSFNNNKKQNNNNSSNNNSNSQNSNDNDSNSYNSSSNNSSNYYKNKKFNNHFKKSQGPNKFGFIVPDNPNDQNLSVPKKKKKYFSKPKNNSNNVNPQDSSYTKLVGKCRFYEINKSTFFTLLMKRLVQKFLSAGKNDEEVNEILVRAQGKEECKKLQRIYFILTKRLTGVSSIYHTCNTRMIFKENKQFNKDQTLKKSKEIVFIKNPNDLQRNFKGFKQPINEGEIMSFEDYKKTFNFKKELEKEIDQKKQEELKISEAIFFKSFLQGNTETQQAEKDEKGNQLDEEVKQNYDDIQKEEKQGIIDESSSESDSDEDDSNDEDGDDDIEQLNEEKLLAQDVNKSNQYQNLSQTKLFKKVEQKIQSNNPHQKIVNKDDLKFSCSYTLTEQVVNLKQEEVKKLEEETSEFMNVVSEKIQKIEQSKQPLQKLSSSDQKDIMKAALFQHYRNQGCKVQITNKITNNQSYANSYQTQLVLTGQTDNLKYVQVSIDDKFYTYEKVVSDDENKTQFLQRFVRATQNQYKVPEDKVTVIDLQKGVKKSINVVTSIDGVQNDQLQSNKIDQYQKEFPKAQVSSVVKSLLDNYQISDDYFNEKFNMYWESYHDTMKDYRGSLPRDGKGSYKQRYYFPVGFQGYGINVQQWMQDDQKWFGQDSDPNVWIVLYHATDEAGFQGISQSYIKPGQNNVYGGTKCRLTGQIIQKGEGANSYFSDRTSGPNSSEDYGGKIKIGNKKYVLMFQCRVNPKHVRSPVDMESYYTVEKEYAQQSVRPYRLLLKEA